MSNDNLWPNLLVFGGCIALLGGVVMCSPLLGGDVPLAYTREVIGVVDAPPATRYVRHKSSGSEKVAVVLRVPPATLSGYQFDHRLMIECLSTRCVALQPGETHDFNCRLDGRFFSEPVVECYHNRMVEGAPSGDTP